MSLKRSAQKDHLESEYERYRARAKKARKNGENEKAARFYTQCVTTLKDLAELETSDKLSNERLALAQNLQEAAEKLKNNQSDDSGEINTRKETDSEVPSSDSGSATETGSSGSKDENETTDPSNYLEEPPEMNFRDVGGMTDLKDTLRDKVIDPLERPELYEEYDLGIVNGVLLHGPPGTGKTYITQALAGELGYNYIEARASDITSSLVGEASKNMAELFEVARDNQPCLLFIDETESIVGDRSGGHQKTSSESQMITQFLTEMSEIKGDDVIVVGATNLPDDIDGAAIRRFEERIEVPPPDATARAAVLRIHLRERPVVTEEIDWDEIKSLTEGYSSSDLEIIASSAARRALKQARERDEVVPITHEHLETAIEETDSSLEAWNK